MTRIALLPSSYPPSLGGVEESTRNLAITLANTGDEVEVWTGTGDDRAPESAEVRDGLVVRRLPMPLPAANLAALSRSVSIGSRTLRSLRRAVAAFRPDVLHVHCFGPNGSYGTALSRRSGIPMVLTLHGETLMDDGDIFSVSRTLRASLRSGIRAAAAVTACSAFALADAEDRFGLPAGRGTVVPNGVSLAEALDGSGELPGPVAALRGRPYVLALGRVVEKKGFDLLLDGYAAMDPGLRSADLVIGGSGPALEALEARAEDSGIVGRVHFTGRLTREQVASTIAGATVFVMPSRLEPFGIVVLEAWRAGVAVVASNRGGAPEFVDDGVNGLLVDPFDAVAMARALERLLSDPDERRALAVAGRRQVEAFDWPVVADRYRAVYDSVLAHSSRTPAAAGAAGDAEPVRPNGVER